jgi:hypothetical protein
MTKTHRSATLLLLVFAGLLTLCARGQDVLLQGLLSANHHGSFTAARYAADGSLFLLLDEGDGVRVVKTDSAGKTVEAQAHVGAAGDSGVALAIDPGGNVYVAGTSRSGTLSGTGGVPFPAPADGSTNSFLAKFDANLNTAFLTFLGSGQTAATSVSATTDSVFVAGIILDANLPVTASGIQQTPANGSSENGFVERFPADGSALLYATYLTGVGGDTEPTGIVADAADHVFVVGETSASGYPTLSALEPAMIGSVSGILSELTPGGDGFVFSTFIAGNGITGLALDGSSNSLLLSGDIALGQFPVATADEPLTSTSYQSLLRIPVDGQSVTEGVVLAPAAESLLTAGPDGSAWVTMTMSTPLLPASALASSQPGDGLLLRVSPAGTIVQSLRFGGATVDNNGYASLTTSLAAPTVSVDGSSVAVPGTITATLSSSLLATQHFDLPMVAAPDALLPSGVQDLVPDAASCNGASQCSGSGGLLALIDTKTASPSLALLTGDLPNLTLRNVGSADALGLAVVANGYSVASDCGSSLSMGAACDLALSGGGPGSVTVSASGAPTDAVTLPATTEVPDALALSATELDFGIASSAAPAIDRSLVISNLSNTEQAFSIGPDAGPSIIPYSVALASTDCATASGQGQYTIAADSSCTVTLSLTASDASSNDGPVNVVWKIGPRDVSLTGFSQAAALNLSASEIDFGTQFSGTGALRLPRYLFLSNDSAAAIGHSAVALPSDSPFAVEDECPPVLEPQSVCRIALGYSAASAPSLDSAVLALDQGLSVLLTGQTLPPQGVSGSAADPNVSVSPSSVAFSDPVTVTEISSTTKGVEVLNTGAAAVSLTVAVTGDFVLNNECPATLAAGGSCELLVSFAPSEPGPREGVLSLGVGGGFSPALVALNGTATNILAANNGTLALGETVAGEPLVAWYKVQPALPTLTVGSNNSVFGFALVEDTGSGHGSLSASAFSSTATGSCVDCWLGIQFLSQTVGEQTATFSLTTVSGGQPETLTLTADATPLTGLVLTPGNADFGLVAVDSMTAPATFSLANLLPDGETVTIESVAASGDFSIVPSTTAGACGATLASTATCNVEVAFAPTASGARTGALTVTTDAGSATASLTGYGTVDPGIALRPASLVFDNQDGAAATQQTITVINTGTVVATIGTPTIGDVDFTGSSTCGTLAAGAQCSIAVTFTPGETLPQTMLSLPVSTGAGTQIVTVNYAVALSATYTYDEAGLLLEPAESNFGPAPTGTMGPTRQFSLTNLTQQSMDVSLELPRQFLLAAPGGCETLAAGATCNFSVSMLPVTNGSLTGTVLASGTFADGSGSGSGPVEALGYLLGYGEGSGALSVASAALPNGPLNFGQVASGQTVQQNVTLTNTGSGPLTIRRLTSEPPFLSTSDCGAALDGGASCTVSVSYAPVDEVAVGGGTSAPRQDTGSLVIESDAVTSPDVVQLAGSAEAVAVANPASSAVLAAYDLSESALTFASTPEGNVSAAQTVMLTNTGTATLHISSVLVPTDFSASSTCGTLLPGNACSINVQFTPGDLTQAAIRSGTLEIRSDAADALEFVSLMGGATAPPLTLAPTSLDFGTVDVGQTNKLSVSVTNVTSSPIVLGGVTAIGEYSADLGTCAGGGRGLAAGASCTLEVTFAPADIGALSGVLSLSSNATQIPLTVSLSGTGVAAPPPTPGFTLAVNGGDSASATVASGAPASFTLTATPAGGFNGPVALTCAPVGSAPYASCSLLASVLTLDGAQSSTATINTITSVSDSKRELWMGLLLLPVALLGLGGAVRGRRRRLPVICLMLLLSVGLAGMTSCGGNAAPQQPAKGLLYTPAGTYQWTVTASSTSGPQITSSVTLTVVVQ